MSGLLSTVLQDRPESFGNKVDVLGGERVPVDVLDDEELVADALPQWGPPPWTELQWATLRNVIELAQDD